MTGHLRLKEQKAVTMEQSRIFQRATHQVMPVALSGSGIYITDAQGKQYIDGCGGAAVSCIGHSQPAVAQAIMDQLGKLAYAHTSFFSSAPAEELAEYLVELAPPGISHAYFVTGGSEAVEAALKLAHQYHQENGQPQRNKIIARWQSYHGNTLGALAASGNKMRRVAYADILIDVVHIEPCYPYRYRRADETLDEYGRRAADLLESKILELGAEHVSCFIMEPVVGASLGAVAAAPGYLKRVREICDRYGVLLIFDEVMCGMGRCGTSFASEHDGVVADIYTIAKGLTSGFVPLGAILLGQRVYDMINEHSGSFRNGHTFSGHPVSCAGALAVQRFVQQHHLLDNVKRQGRELERQLLARFGSHANVGEIRGRGLFFGVELVADKNTRTPFGAQLGVAARVKQESLRRGLLVYPGSGTSDGVNGDHILLAPHYIVSEEEIGCIVERLAQAVDAVLENIA
ncbi:aspartate aminotransferase family protein [Pollutimonas bauzanensis]|uniref:Adenosylmethionine-8-amino-7-oxononanoate aminotransferase n=1 Tax=Pollutimonas bauzanensis TaxID=658167 RepID=A0A1M5VIV6_9BURK|nr:hypothetical protein SAMN04488135_104403 [Pollutimonas bauzanensis]